MKKLIIFLLFASLQLPLLAQEGYIQTITKEHNYQALKNFLSGQKFSNRTFRQQFEEWFNLAKKHEPANAIAINSSHVIQTMPLDYGAKDLSWISPSKRYNYRDRNEYLNASFGNQVLQDIIYGAGNNILQNIGRKKYRYHYSAAENSKPYQRPSFLQF